MQEGYWFDGAFWVVFAGFAITSVQWGRGRWAFSGLRALLVVGNVIAVAVVLPVLAAADGRGYEATYADGDPAYITQGCRWTDSRWRISTPTTLRETR